MILEQYEFENQPSTYSCDIAPTNGADARLTLYARGVVGSDGWVDLPGDLMAVELCTLRNNTLQFKLAGIPLNVVFWEEGSYQYGVGQFQDGNTPCTLMLTREI